MRSLVLMLSFLWASSVSADDASTVHDLTKLGIDPTAKSIAAYLRTVVEEEQQIAAWVRQLGDPSFRRRAEATRLLLQAIDVDRDLLEKAAASDDPEVRARAKRILKELGKHPTARHRGHSLVLVLSVVADQRIKKLTRPLLDVISHTSHPVIHQRAIDALKATVDPDDLYELRAALAGKSPALRIAALMVIETLLGKDVSADATPLLGDKDETVRLTAALTLANLGDRRALPVFGRLLNSDRQSTRFRAAHILRQLTGKRFGFVAHDEIDHRAAPTTEWILWIDVKGPTAKLAFPVKGFAVDTRGLVLHLSFDKAESPVADQSGCENHGTLHNARHVEKGCVGGACHLDGRGDYVNIANSETLEIRETLTIAVWVKLDSFAPGGYGNEEGHIVKKGNPLWWNPAYGLGYRKGSRRAKFVIGHPTRPTTRGGADLYSDTLLRAGRWHHLAGTYDGKTARLYIDGRLDVEKKYTGKIRTDRAPVMLGGGRLGSTTGFSNHFAITGTVDELRIYDRALEPEEVAALAHH